MGSYSPVDKEVGDDLVYGGKLDLNFSYMVGYKLTIPG